MIRAMENTDSIRLTIIVDKKVASDLNRIVQKRSVRPLRKLSVSELFRVAARYWLDAGAPMPGTVQDR